LFPSTCKPITSSLIETSPSLFLSKF
jgi:hypothetical protein